MMAFQIYYAGKVTALEFYDYLKKNTQYNRIQHRHFILNRYSISQLYLEFRIVN